MIDETDDMNKLYIIYFVNYNFVVTGYCDSQFLISEVSVNTVMYAAQGIRFIFSQVPLSYTQKEYG